MIILILKLISNNPVPTDNYICIHEQGTPYTNLKILFYTSKGWKNLEVDYYHIVVILTQVIQIISCILEQILSIALTYWMIYSNYI